MSLSNKMNKSKVLAERFVAIEYWMITAMNEKELYIYAILKNYATIEGYTIRRCEIQKKVPFGRDAFSKAWMSLQKKGFLKSIKKRNTKGEFETDFYILYSKGNMDDIDLIKEEDFVLDEDDKVEVGKVGVEESTGMSMEEFEKVNEKESQEKTEEEIAKEEMKKDVKNIDSRCKVLLRKNGTYELLYDKTLFKKSKNKKMFRNALCNNMKVIMSRTGLMPTSWSNFMASKMDLVDIYQTIKNFKKTKGRTFYFFCCQYISYCEKNNRPINDVFYAQIEAIKAKEIKGKRVKIEDKNELETLVEQRINDMPSEIYTRMMDELSEQGYKGDELHEKFRYNIETEVILMYGKCI